jgi:hypothetical protein
MKRSCTRNGQGMIGGRNPVILRAILQLPIKRRSHYLYHRHEPCPACSHSRKHRPAHRAVFKMQLPTVISLVALLSAANAQTTVGFGPAFSLGPTKSWIREATTTLVLPKVPSPAKDRLALWPGMGTSSGSLIQALAVAFSDPNA